MWFPAWDRAVAQVNGIAVWAEGIKAELAQRLPRQRKTQRDKLAVLVATMLHVRSANLVEMAAGLPRAPGGVLGPLLRQVKLAIDQRMPFAAGISQEHANLAVLDAPGSAAVLACHPGRLGAFLQKAGLVDDQHRFPIGQALDHVGATRVTRGRLVPLHMREQPLRAPRPGVAEMLGQLPAVLAFDRTQQALKIEPGLPTRLGPYEQLAQAGVQRTQLRAPIKNTPYPHSKPRCDPTPIPAI